MPNAATPFPTSHATPRRSFRRLPLLLAGIALAAVVGVAAPGVATGQGEPGGTEAGNGATKAAADPLDETDLGIEVEDVKDVRARLAESAAIEFPKRGGVVVKSVTRGTNACHHGIEPLTVIHSVNREAVKTRAEFNTIVSRMSAGDEIAIVRSDPQTPPKGSRGKRKILFKTLPEERFEIETVGDTAVGLMEPIIETFSGNRLMRHESIEELERSRVYLAFMKPIGKPASNLRWMINYDGDEWVFMRKCILRVDGNAPVQIDLAGKEIAQKIHGDGSVTESVQGPVSDANKPLLALLEKRAKEIALRIEGRAGIKDRILDDEEAAALVATARAYRELQRHPAKGD